MSPHGTGDDRDPAMTRFMEDWGASVRRGTVPIFERPPESPALDARLDAIDAELSSAAAARPLATRRLRIAAATAAAAAVLVATAWLAFRGDVRAPRLGALRAVPVVESGGVARSAPSDVLRFRTGDRIDLRFETDAPAAVRIAALGAGGALRLVAAEAIDAAGPRSVGPFVFEGEPGVETFVVIAGPRDAAPGDFDALLAKAMDAARATPDRPLDAALERIRRDGRYSAEALALRHER